MHGHGLKKGEGFTEFLREIVEDGQLTGTALDITEKVIAEGKKSLSKRQKAFFEDYVENKFVTEECQNERCQNDCPIPYSEMFAAYKNGRWCGKCSSSKPKNDRPSS